MGKLIAKTAAITFACILVVALVLFGIFSLFIPSVMVSLTDQLGMEGPCASYSVAQYKKTGKIDDLAVAVERSYFAMHYDDAAECGEELLQNNDFAKYCTDRDASSSSGIIQNLSSMQYFSGIVAESQYRVGKGDLAIDTAFSALDEIEFPRFLNNAVVYLGTAAVDEGDAAYCEQILSRLEQEYAQVELYPGLAEFETMLRDFIDGPTE